MASSSSMKKKITLKSSDGETFEIEKAVALESQTIKHLIDDVANDNTVIPISNVAGNILAKVIEYCKKHVEEASEDELKKWDDEFIKFDHDTLFKITVAANYLDIKSLLDLSFMTIADNIKEKTPEEIRKIFNIENDYTPEEEAAVREEYAWAFEKE